MALLARLLIVQKGVIEELQSQMIQVMNAIYGGERFEFDGSKLVDKGSHLPGFSLDKSGLLRASKVNISGDFKADSIEAGPLSVSQNTPSGITRNFGTNETAKNIYDAVREVGIFKTIGYFGLMPLQFIEFIITTTSNSSYPNLYRDNTYEVFIIANNIRILIAKSIIKTQLNVINNEYTESAEHSLKLSNSLSFKITLVGKTLKLNDLPTTVPAEKGTVFKIKEFNSDYSILKVKD
jgi:hypothetical protein